MTWIEEFDRNPGRVVRRPDHSVKMSLGPQGVQYKEQRSSITLPAALEDLTPELGRRWLVLRTYGLIIQVPSVLRWDDGLELSREKSNGVKDRISSALNEIGMRHVFQAGEDTE